MFTIKFGSKTFSRVSVGRSSLGNISKKADIIKVRPVSSNANIGNNVIPSESVKLFDGNTGWNDSRVWDDSVIINFN